MAILKNVTRTVNSSPKACFFAEHDGTNVIRTGQGMIGTPNQLICADSQSDLDAEITRLKLTPKQTNRQKAAAYFQTLSTDIQSQFAAAFQAISVIPNDVDAIAALQAVTVPDNLIAAKAALLNIMQTGNVPVTS